MDPGGVEDQKSLSLPDTQAPQPAPQNLDTPYCALNAGKATKLTGTKVDIRPPPGGSEHKRN